MFQNKKLKRNATCAIAEVALRFALLIALCPPLFFGFSLHVFRQAGLPQRVDCLAQIETCVKCLSKNTATHCQLENRTRGQQPFDHNRVMIAC